MTHKIIQGHVLDELKKLEEGSVNCVVTSPPYWGLRVYETEPQIWQNRHEMCVEHEWGEPIVTTAKIQTDFSERGLKRDGRPEANRLATNASSERMGTAIKSSTSICSRCGAWRGELGLEPRPQMYVEHLVLIFREVRRVLKNDGTLWLIIGDSYNGSGKGGDKVGHEGKQTTNRGTIAIRDMKMNDDTLKPKDLVGIPWRVAFALQKDGWYLRSDCIWSKPNAMPDSTEDRPTKGHEYIFFLTKSRRYYYDNSAVREPSVTGTWDAMPPIDGTKHTGKNGNPTYSGNQPSNDGKRNLRSVWTVATHPYREAHFATFPPKLIQPCILAGCPKDGVVLDPFSGAGTTGLVANENGRNYIGIELNPKYVAMSLERLRKQPLGIDFIR